MGNILLISENDDIFNKYKKLLDTNEYNFNACCTPTAIFDLIEISPIDVILIDDYSENLNLLLTIKRLKTKQENAQILLLYSGESIDEEVSKLVSGFVLKNSSDELIVSTINSHLKTKEKLDILSGKNKDLADSLYRLNVLYNTSSQFADTLDTKELLNYMLEGIVVPEDIREKMGMRMIGCDACQRACPLQPLEKEDEKEDADEAFYLDDFLHADENQFREGVMHLARVIGKNAARPQRIRAQAALLAGNRQHEKDSKTLRVWKESSFEAVREHAQWACERIERKTLGLDQSCEKR